MVPMPPTPTPTQRFAPTAQVEPEPLTVTVPLPFWDWPRRPEVLVSTPPFWINRLPLPTLPTITCWPAAAPPLMAVVFGVVVSMVTLVSAAVGTADVFQ